MQGDTKTQGFEKAGQSSLVVEPGECSECMKKFGERGRKSGLVNVVTARGQDTWCQECFEKGLEEGTCKKVKKLTKKEKKQLKKEKKLAKFSLGVKNVKRNKKGEIDDMELVEISIVGKDDPKVVVLDEKGK